jgi:hypothetical protein
MAKTGESPHAKRDVIAQALLDGCDEQQIHARLIDSGASDKSADYELKRLAKDPFFAAARQLSNRLAKRDWTLDLYARLHSQNDAAHSIPTLHAIEPERFFRAFYFANRPVKLTGLVDHWPALERWTLDYLDQTLGNAVVELQGQRGASPRYESDKTAHERRVPMRAVIELLRRDEASNDFYITAYNDKTNKATLAPLWDDLAPVSILRESGGRDGFFWMGPRGTLTPFHHDLTNNLLVQISGRKRVRMVPSWETARMRNSLHCFSDWTLDEFLNDDIATPPMLECTIDAGEAIFLPIGWWHHVEALDRSISMSFTNFAADNDFTGGYPADSRF